MRTINRVTAVVGAVMALALIASAPATALSNRSGRQTFVLYGAGSTFDHPISVFAAGPISGVGSFEITDERSSEQGEDFTAGSSEAAHRNGMNEIRLRTVRTILAARPSSILCACLAIVGPGGNQTSAGGSRGGFVPSLGTGEAR